MAKLDPRIEVIREKYGLDASDFWELPQKKGTWVAKHSALEVAAAKAGIIFDSPQIIEADTQAGIAVVAVVGTVDGAPQRREWSIGEASPKNNKNSYPWAMAEKRAKDRVILKLIGIHGLVYSEDEFGGGEVAGEESQPKPKRLSRDMYQEMAQEIDACADLDSLSLLWRSAAFQTEFKALPRDWQDMLTNHKDARKAELSAPADGAFVPPKFDHLEQQHG